MITRQDIITRILRGMGNEPKLAQAESYAPANIALVKYWGKRNGELNLPVTSSFSISLGDHGTTTKISLNNKEDQLIINNNIIEQGSSAMIKAKKFLDLFRKNDEYFFTIESSSNIPIAAGVASSSAAFASITKTLDKLFAWNLDDKDLSIIARFGSGSACRSLWHGFVEWNKGELEDGMDSYAKLIDDVWEDLNIGLMILSSGPKSISSREAMEITRNTSTFYKSWPLVVEKALADVHIAIKNKDFTMLGAVAENNALAMHATMIESRPPICYFSPKTIEVCHQVWNARKSGLEVYFTQDAGPNIKLLFQKKDRKSVEELFSGIDIIEPFAYKDLK